MSRICYIDRTFNRSSREVIEQAQSICASYAAQGYDLTLRQLYYQFVSRGLLPNLSASYNRLGSIVNDARLAGLIDWNHIVDRVRAPHIAAHWNDPTEIIDAVAAQYREDLWKNQATAVEVWVEKDALIGVLETACAPLDVPYFACKGYASASSIWRAAQRMLNRQRINRQPTVVLHLGDHDPSGLDMTRDISERLELFHEFHGWAGPTVKRIALNMDQVEAYDPPPNPAKLTDSRAEQYVFEYGSSSWELDALDPATLGELITTEVLALRDEDQWETDLAEMNRRKDVLRLCSSRWTEVESFLNNGSYSDDK